MTPLEDLIKTFSRFPGLGKKTASRMAFHLLKADEIWVRTLGQQILEIRTRIQKCRTCGNFSEGERCEICMDPTRDQRTLCVVEQVQDLLNLQTTGEYKGLYFVLHGVIAPLDGIGPQQLGFDRLEARLKELGTDELILATNPTMEGDTTALYIQRLFSPLVPKITRLASGLPVGGDLEYADRLTLARSLKARLPLN